MAGSAAAQRAASESARAAVQVQGHRARVPEHRLQARPGADLVVQVAGVGFHQHGARVAHLAQLFPTADVEAAPVPAHLGRGHEEVRAHAVGLQQGPGDLVHRAVGVVDGQHHRAVGQRPARRHQVGHLVEGHHPGAAVAEPGQVALELGVGRGPELAFAQGGHAEQQRAQHLQQVAGLEILAEVVVAEHRHARLAAADEHGGQLRRVEVVVGRGRGCGVPIAAASGSDDRQQQQHRQGRAQAAAHQNSARAEMLAKVRL